MPLAYQDNWSSRSRKHHSFPPALPVFFLKSHLVTLAYPNVIYAIWLGCLSSCLPARLKVPFYAKPSLFHLERAHHMRQALISPPSVERVLLYLPCCGHRQNEHHALSLIHPAFLESCLYPSSRITWIMIRVPPCLGWCGIRYSAFGTRGRRNGVLRCGTT